MWSGCALIAVLGGVAALVATRTHAATPAVHDAKLRADLEQVARRTIFFGHQSVGFNLLDGMQQLASDEGVGLRIAEVKPSGTVLPRTLNHGVVPENGNPALKLQSFERVLSTAGDVDIAFVKFCFADIRETTDVGALFQRYQATVAALKAKYPRTVFIHVTAPLTTIQRGPKAWVKWMLGRTPGGILENIRRDDYNGMLRNAVAGKEPLFDLARVESLGPDGRPSTVSWKGRAVPELVGAFTDDGGHLNGQARLLAARELASVLAAAAAGMQP